MFNSLRVFKGGSQIFYQFMRMKSMDDLRDKTSEIISLNKDENDECWHRNYASVASNVM